MAQPLLKSDETTSGIDKAVSRLEQAFIRLEAAALSTRTAHHSLKEDNGKLNHLLQAADSEIGKLREAVYTVTERLDRTIGQLERDA